MSARASLVATLALALVTGRILDRTTGQGLAHVSVSSGRARATTDASGRFTLRGVAAGAGVLTVRGDDVPPQHFRLTFGSGTNHVDVRACSTTLDYSCAQPGSPTTGGTSAG